MQFGNERYEHPSVPVHMLDSMSKITENVNRANKDRFHDSRSRSRFESESPDRDAYRLKRAMSPGRYASPGRSSEKQQLRSILKSSSTRKRN